MSTHTLHTEGFTLVELLIALFVISVSFTGIVSLMSQNIRTSAFTETQLQAVFLAQEGVEIVRNIRDDNVKKGFAWNHTLIPGTYAVQYDRRDLISDQHENALKRDESQFFTYESGEETRFRRSVTLTNAQDTEGAGYIRVHAEVSWDGVGGEEEEVSVETRIYDNAF